MARPIITPQKAPPKIPAEFDRTVVDRALTGIHGRVQELESRTGDALTGATALTDLTSLVGTGRLWLGRRIIAATGTYTPTAGATRASIRMIGGGGGGGGAQGSVTAVAAGAGGSSGVYVEFVIQQLSTYIISIGAAGAGFGDG